MSDTSEKLINIDDIQQYSINSLWINRTLNKKNTFVTNHKTQEEFINNVLEKISKWKKTNPNAEVNFWYDGEFVTAEQLSATRDVLKLISDKDPEMNIQLKNIREIYFVRDNPDAFSDYIPLYTRVDLMKLVLCVNELEHKGMDATIFSDLDVGEWRENKDRPAKAELFSPEEMKTLSEFGYIQNDIENQFYQIVNKPETLLALKIYINASLSRIVTALNLKWNLEGASDQTNQLYHEKAMQDLCTMVYNAYDEQLIPLIYAFNKNKPIFFKDASNEWVKFDPAKHTGLDLGNFYFRQSGLSTKLRVPDFEITNFNQMKSLKNQLIIPDPEDDPTLEVDFYYRKNRIKTRKGGDHIEEYANLVERKPVDGSQVYKSNPYVICDVPSTELEKTEKQLILFSSKSKLKNETDKSPSHSAHASLEQITDHSLKDKKNKLKH